MPIRIPFRGGTFVLRDAGEFTDKKTGEHVQYDAALLINGDKTPQRHPPERCDELEKLFQTAEYKAWRAKAKK